MAKQKLGPSLPQDGSLLPKIVNELPNITLHLKSIHFPPCWCNCPQWTSAASVQCPTLYNIIMLRDSMYCHDIQLKINIISLINKYIYFYSWLYYIWFDSSAWFHSLYIVLNTVHCNAYKCGAMLSGFGDQLII